MGLQTGPDTTGLGLTSYKWYLSAIHQEGKTVGVTVKRAFIRFDVARGSAGGNGSCNSFGSSMTLNGDKISFKEVFSTKMYCEEVQSVENSFFEQLQKVTRFSIVGGKLLLYGGDSLLLEFDGVAGKEVSQ